MEIRVLGPEDAEAYLVVRLRGLDEAPRAFSTSAVEQRARPLEVTRRKLTPRPGTFVLGAFEGGAMLGTVAVFRDGQAQAAHKGMVCGMYVVPEARGRGLGRALLEGAVTRARAAGLEVLLLGVGEDNPGAKALYEAVGFQGYGAEPDAFRVAGVPVDEALMRLVL